MTKDQVILVMRENGFEDVFEKHGVKATNALYDGLYKAIRDGFIPAMLLEAQKDPTGTVNGVGLRFKARTMAERNGTNPRTGEPIKIPSHIVHSISVSESTKARVRNNA